MSDRVSLEVRTAFDAQSDGCVVQILARWRDTRKHVAFKADRNGDASAADVVAALRVLAAAIENHPPRCEAPHPTEGDVKHNG